MADAITGTRGWRYHPERDALLAEAHARPYAPLELPMLATRIATLSGQDGADIDRRHMTALCRRLGQAEPSPDSRWCAMDAGNWRLRWERHTEFSTWTFFRTAARAHPFAESALDLAPVDWLAALPGEVLVATNLELRGKEGGPSPTKMLGADAIGARILDGAASVFTDLRPDASGKTRYLVLMNTPDAALTGRLAIRMMELETYRLMALLAFPLAGTTARRLTRMEERAGEIAAQLAREAGDDRALLDSLVTLAAEAEALSGETSFRFGAARAYYNIVLDRIASLREQPIEGLQTLGEFMERRLAPAMRTCDAVFGREQAAIERIARTERMLNTRVEVAAEATSAALLRSMDRRARLQLRLQQTVEGLSVVAIAYYALALLTYVIKAVGRVRPLDETLWAGIAAPLVLLAVWLALRRLRSKLRVGED